MCKYDLSHYLEQFRDGAVKAENVDKTLVSLWVLEKIKEMKEDYKERFLKVYNRITDLVAEHIEIQALPISTFDKDLYQIYVAATICLSEKPFIC